MTRTLAAGPGVGSAQSGPSATARVFIGPLLLFTLPGLHTAPDEARVVTLLNRVGQARLWSSPSCSLRLDAALCQHVGTTEDGRTIVVLPVSYDRTHMAPIQWDHEGQAVDVVPGRRIVSAERLAAFSIDDSRLSMDGRRLFHLREQPAVVTLNRYGPGGVLSVDGQHLSRGRTPRVSATVDGVSLPGSVQRDGRIAFQMPRGLGAQRCIVTPLDQVEPRPAIAAFELSECGGRDRLLLAPDTEQTGFTLIPAPPAPALPWPVARVPQPQLLMLPGRCGVVVDSPADGRTLSVEGIQATPPVRHGATWVFDVEEAGLATLSWNGPAPAQAHVIQPSARHGAPIPFLRQPDGSALGPRLIESAQILAETRRAWLCTEPRTLSLGAVPAGRLELEAAALDLFPAPLPRPPVTVEVILQNDGEESVLARWPVEALPEGRHAGWRPFALNLPTAGTLSIRRASCDSSPVLDSLTLVALAEPRLVVPGTPRPNLLIYLIDTLRADHLAFMGYEHATSPRLDEVASEAFVFEHMVSSAPWTRPSVASLFTGWFQTFHGVTMETGVDPQLVTLAEAFQDAGYETAAVVSNLHVHGPSLHFDQGFHRFVGILEEGPMGSHRAARVHQDIDTFLDARSDRPFFLYAHTLDPHWPYDPPPTTVGAFGSPGLEQAQTAPESLAPETLRALYDEEILSNDEWFGRLIDDLKRRGLYENTAVLFLADHGEELMDHGSTGHLGRGWHEVVHVPMFLKLPGTHEPKRIQELVRNVDVWPTLAALFGLDVPDTGLQGVDLSPLWSGTSLWSPLPALSEDRGSGLVAFTLGSWKLIDRAPTDGDPRTWLFELDADPAERVNLAETLPEMVASLRQAREAYIAQLGESFPRLEGPRAKLSSEMRQALSALGYAHDHE